jgi:hypothetical protein
VCIPTINHASPAFIENKRYPTKPHAFDDVVNRNAVSVYQTDQVLILAGAVQGRRSRRTHDEKQYEYVDVP